MADTMIARAESPRGDVVLRRRGGDNAIELRVNGVFVMDTVETATERILATLALEEVGLTSPGNDGAGLRVMVGGLGLGFTLRQFATSPRVAEIIVAEIEPAIVEWHLAGLVPDAAETLRDPRVQVQVADIQDVLGAQPDDSLDVIALDVDNGPGFLVYDDNAAIYEDEFLTRCRAALTPTGRLVVWSADHAPRLCRTLERVFGSVEAHSRAVTLGRRVDSYHAYVAPRRPLGDLTCPAP